MRLLYLLQRRCVEYLDPPSPSPETMPEDLLALLDVTMAELDPQAELRLSVRCVRCGLEFSTVLDAGGWLYEEVSRHARHLYQGIHLLALHYHWGERELMTMTPRERGRYLGLLEEALAGADR